jgi:hypothetical protein
VVLPALLPLIRPEIQPQMGLEELFLLDADLSTWYPRWWFFSIRGDPNHLALHDMPPLRPKILVSMAKVSSFDEVKAVFLR